ncbi:hypothetical protein [Pseudomonas sp. 5P_3.1_Bac2]|uniref:hypothetical protein n=1 Tax=Pseudomonas sp. 5P_3.1_Bac2 TaxID=2971617 RepID=UPI0021C9BC4A|nr:hypothetical protein [Pseudomonas sp. 5P_3.1_Bac2]MCU1716438.1 hypothetical protein [Pseudomonas sp. 5P_3.1_Bac2]
MNQEILNIAFEEDTDTDAILSMKEALLAFGEEVSFHEFPKRGPQASIFLLTMSSVVLVFGASFAKKLGEKSAEATWQLVEKGLSKLYAKYFGENPEHRIYYVASSEKKLPKTKYSLTLSLLCTGSKGESIKFIYETKWSQAQFNKATRAYLRAMPEFTSNGTGVIQDLIEKHPTRLSPFLIAWDAGSEELVFVNVMPTETGI